MQLGQLNLPLSSKLFTKRNAMIYLGYRSFKTKFYILIYRKWGVE